jgi:hypothetical protein
MEFNCNVVEKQGKQCMVLDGDSAARLFYATAKLHNATVEDFGDTGFSWESSDARYELTYVGDVPHLTIMLKG